MHIVMPQVLASGVRNMKEIPIPQNLDSLIVHVQVAKNICTVLEEHERNFDTTECVQVGSTFSVAKKSSTLHMKAKT